MAGEAGEAGDGAGAAAAAVRRWTAAATGVGAAWRRWIWEPMGARAAAAGPPGVAPTVRATGPERAGAAGVPIPPAPAPPAGPPGQPAKCGIAPPYPQDPSDPGLQRRWISAERSPLATPCARLARPRERSCEITPGSDERCTSSCPNSPPLEEASSREGGSVIARTPESR